MRLLHRCHLATAYRCSSSLSLHPALLHAPRRGNHQVFPSSAGRRLTYRPYSTGQGERDNIGHESTSGEAGDGSYGVGSEAAGRSLLRRAGEYAPDQLRSGDNDDRAQGQYSESRREEVSMSQMSVTQDAASRLQKQDSLSASFYQEIESVSLGDRDAPDTVDEGVLEEEAGLEGEDGAEGDVVESVEPEAEEVADEPTEPPYTFTYKMPEATLAAIKEAVDKGEETYWSHKQFKGPEGQDVTVEYCVTLEQSEAAAKKFLDEKVLGFDMEWSMFPSASIKMNISVIQIACADRIAVFHIAQHPGTSVDKVLAPSLKKIIESPEYTKTGVNILVADGQRLEQWFRVKPQGLFELSHLWRLIQSERNSVNPEEISRKLRAMAFQVNDQLGSPLLKDSVRTSDWTRPLTQKQIDYAAADAYAGFMLFHVMNEKRKLMKPTPPLPAFAELKQPIQHRLGPLNESEKPKARAGSTGVKTATQPRYLDKATAHLYSQLSLSRVEIAQAKGIPPFNVAASSTLKEIAAKKPSNLEELKQITGIGSVRAARYGEAWLELVRKCVSEWGQDAPTTDSKDTSEAVVNDRTADGTDSLHIKLLEGSGDCLSGLSFVFTGTLQHMTRLEAHSMISCYGGEVHEKALRHTSYVVMGEDVSAAKLEAIQEYNLTTISESELYNLIHEKSTEQQDTRQQNPEAQRAPTQQTSPTDNGQITSLPASAIPPDAPQTSNSTPSAATSAPTPEPQPIRFYKPLFQALIKLRVQIASQTGHRRDAVAPDSTLYAIAAWPPRRPWHDLPGATLFREKAAAIAQSLDELVAKHTPRLASVDLIGIHTPTTRAAGAGAAAAAAGSSRPGPRVTKNRHTLRQPRKRNTSFADTSGLTDAEDEGSSDEYGFADGAQVQQQQNTHHKHRSQSRASSAAATGMHSGRAQLSGAAATKTKAWVYDEIVPPPGRKRKF